MKEALKQIENVINQLDSIIKEQAELIASMDVILTGGKMMDLIKHIEVALLVALPIILVLMIIYRLAVVAPYQCQICGKIFDNQTDYDYHMKLEETYEQFRNSGYKKEEEN
ncbi:MAG: C2H2-type zinc finger protein [Candidatus Marinimicrobia bacterium]|jgi:hypothetical protein|nr:C2H2-type zinc finger protein [Sphaerochaeta sp.]MDD5060690.1 C2H2-type zinc finger protein [Candidatus Neomarinimicrobiota bacterium]